MFSWVGRLRCRTAIRTIGIAITLLALVTLSFSAGVREERSQLVMQSH